MSTFEIQKINRNIAYAKIFSDDNKNSIDPNLINTFHSSLDQLDSNVTVLLIQGGDLNFCSGAKVELLTADANERAKNPTSEHIDPKSLYSLWYKLKFGNRLTVAQTRGLTAAGGIGFISACDFCIAESDSIFTLSEMLFGVFPACVLPFLIPRVGQQEANNLVLSCRKLDVSEAHALGLVDAVNDTESIELKRLLSRLARHSLDSIIQYKQYMRSLCSSIHGAEELAVNANKSMFESISAREKFKSYSNLTASRI